MPGKLYQANADSGKRVVSHPECCAYPPRLAREVEIASEVDGAKTTFVIGSPEVGRYLKIGVVEHRVIELLDGTAGATAICSNAKQRYGLALQGTTLMRFLSKLEDAGILEGQRRHTGQTNVN